MCGGALMHLNDARSVRHKTLGQTIFLLHLG